MPSVLRKTFILQFNPQKAIEVNSSAMERAMVSSILVNCTRFGSFFFRLKELIEEYNTTPPDRTVRLNDCISRYLASQSYSMTFDTFIRS